MAIRDTNRQARINRVRSPEELVELKGKIARYAEYDAEIQTFSENRTQEIPSTAIKRWTTGSVADMVLRWHELNDSNVSSEPYRWNPDSVSEMVRRFHELNDPASDDDSEGYNNDVQVNTETAKTYQEVGAQIDSEDSAGIEGAIVPDEKEEAGVDDSVVIRPLVEWISHPELMHMQIGMGVIFEDFREHLRNHDEYEDPLLGDTESRDYLFATEPGKFVWVNAGETATISGYFTTGGEGEWSYIVNPVRRTDFRIGQIVQVPVAPYRGTRGTHYRKLTITRIDIGVTNNAYKSIYV